jgi:hypothetical protein
VATGKRVGTKLRELARLKWDWDAPERREWLRQNWPNAVELTVSEVKRWVRENNPDAKGQERWQSE